MYINCDFETTTSTKKRKQQRNTNPQDYLVFLFTLPFKVAIFRIYVTAVLLAIDFANRKFSYTIESTTRVKLRLREGDRDFSLFFRTISFALNLNTNLEMIVNWKFSQTTKYFILSQIDSFHSQ